MIVFSVGNLREYKIKEKVTLNWSSRGDLVYTGDGLGGESNISPPPPKGSSPTKRKPYLGRVYTLPHEDWTEGEEALGMAQHISCDISRVMCQRAVAGYGMQVNWGDFLFLF